MTRIVAGARGGRRIAAPAGRATRPTSDRVREALFSALTAMTEIAGCRFADLYAGSGAVGLEAASRGASHVLLVESATPAAVVIRQNIAALDLGQVCALRTARLPLALAEGPPGRPYDVVFADPPYELAERDLTALLSALVSHEWLALDAVVVVERSTRSPEPVWVPGLTVERGRRYGESTLWYGRRA